MRKELVGVMEQANEVAGRATIALGSPGVVDEESWSAVSAILPAAAGVIQNPSVWDFGVTPNKVYYLADFPVELPLERGYIRGIAEGKNTGDYAQQFTITIEFIDPNGVARGTHSITSNTSPGATISGLTDNVILDKVGAWTLHVTLEA